MKSWIPKRAAVIEDLAGYGRCSLTIALPVLSVAGMETVPIPTALLSSHTGGLPGVVSTDLTDSMLPAARQYAQLGVKFDAVYTGYLGSVSQIAVVQEMLPLLRKPDTLLLVDPVMGDNGRLYRSVNPAMAEQMRLLCRKADFITPNLTEAACLLGRDPGEIQTSAQAAEAVKQLCALFGNTVVLTGVIQKDSIGALIGQPENPLFFAAAPRTDGAYHGTGDLFASVLLAGLLRGCPVTQAAARAAEFTSSCVQRTAQLGFDERAGLCFEPMLGQLRVDRPF